MESLESLYCDKSSKEKKKRDSDVQFYPKASKPHSTPLTLKWLKENYELADGVCLPRSTLYQHYLDFCHTNDTNPVNAASFGKIIRQQFPLVTTRRLGTRGQSKYHYYGIGLKGGVHYAQLDSYQPTVMLNDVAKECLKKAPPSCQPKIKTVLLPDFPNVKELHLPESLPESKVVTFVMMYRAHCQRILDALTNSSFDEVSSFLHHFWQGMPSHMVSLLHHNLVVKLIGVCDSILYHTVTSSVLPSVTQPIPDSLNQLIRKFTKNFVEWMRQALSGLPEDLREMKLELAKHLTQLLKRKLSLSHLAQASRTVLASQEVTGQLLLDWLSIDLNSIVKQTLYTLSHCADKEHRVMSELCYQFQKLLEDQASIEAYIHWLDTMVDTCVVKVCQRKPGSFSPLSRQFLLMWSCFGTRVIRDMTLHSAPSFGSFHLIHLTFNDYVLYKIETLHQEEKVNRFMQDLKGEIRGDLYEQGALPDPSLVRCSYMDSTCFNKTLHSDRGALCSESSWNSFTDSDYDSRSESCNSDEESLEHSPVQSSSSFLDSCVYRTMIRDSSSCAYQARPHQQENQQTHQPMQKNHYHQPHVEPQHQIPQQVCYSESYPGCLSLQQLSPGCHNIRPEPSTLNNNSHFLFPCSNERSRTGAVFNTNSSDLQTARPFQQIPEAHVSGPVNKMDGYNTSYQGSAHAHAKDTPTENDVSSETFSLGFIGSSFLDYTTSWGSVSKRKCQVDVTRDTEHAKLPKQFKDLNSSLFS
ncbi:transcription factor RFX4-like [Biomphalaria glabrata]|uniref:DNA-binding protein RFX6 n=1 Tax=Biomphalaria glabrata TaxID=6526 RepID=A0A9W2YRU0_BIOGL|nr:transcription factor RFX4-like [Biomphalaria glabrata]